LKSYELTESYDKITSSLVFLKRPNHGIHVAGCVVVHQSEHDGMDECNHVLGPVGRDAQQDVGAKHVKQKNQVNQAGKVEHCDDWDYNISK
jgi:hypothetical protein